MLDLLGFWGNVTVFTFILLFPLVLVSAFLLYRMVYSITQDKELASKASDLLYDHQDGYGHAYCYVLTKQVAEEVPWVLLGVSVLTWLILGIYCDKSSTDVVSAISTWSQALSGFTSGIFLVILCYQGIVFLGRRVYKTYQRVKKVLERASSDD